MGKIPSRIEKKSENMRILNKKSDLAARVLMAGWTLSLPIIGVNKDCLENKMLQSTQEKQETTAVQENTQSAAYFPIYYRDQWHLMPMHRVYERKVEKGDTIEEWWIKEERQARDIDLAKLIFLVFNSPDYYPKDFDRNLNLYNKEIVLIAGENANFPDLNNDGLVLGEPAKLLKVSDVERITAQKNNYGELYD